MLHTITYVDLDDAKVHEVKSATPFDLRPGTPVFRFVVARERWAVQSHTVVTEPNGDVKITAVSVPVGNFPYVCPSEADDYALMMRG